MVGHIQSGSRAQGIRAAHSYLTCFFVHHALRDSTASVDELRFKALRAVLSPTSYESGKAERKALRAFKKVSV